MQKQKILSILLTIILLLSISISSFATNNIGNNEQNSSTKSTNMKNNTQNSTKQNNTTQNSNTQNNTTQSGTTQNSNTQNTESNIINSNDINELTNQKNETQEKIEDINSKIEYVQAEITNGILEIQKLDDKIRGYEQENTNLKQRIENLENSIKETSEKLEVTTNEYNKRNELLRKRLVTLYEEGDVAYLEVLLSAKSLSEFLGMYYAMVQIAEYDNSLIDEVNQKKHIIETSKQKLENETTEVKNLKMQAERSETILKNTKNLQQGSIEKLSQKEKELNTEIMKYKNDIVLIEAKIQELTGYTGDINIQYTGGIMIWPVAVAGTRITSYYGTREHPIEGIIKLHQGIDIGSAGFGAPVVAAADGMVTYAGELGSYGNCVMIYHGNGLITLYGHGQEILTKNGEQVKQGDVIMKVGSTGNSTGPHLHFEVRVNGATTNPLNYVKAP